MQQQCCWSLWVVLSSHDSERRGNRLYGASGDYGWNLGDACRHLGREFEHQCFRQCDRDYAGHDVIG